MIRNEEIKGIELMQRVEGTIEGVPEFISKITSEAETYFRISYFKVLSRA